MSSRESLSGIEHERLLMDYFDAGEYMSCVIKCLDRAAVTVPRAGDDVSGRARRIAADAQALRKELSTIYDLVWDVSPNE